MAMRVLSNVPLAEEATQDTFMKVWREADSWDPERGKLVSLKSLIKQLPEQQIEAIELAFFQGMSHRM